MMGNSMTASVLQAAAELVHRYDVTGQRNASDEQLCIDIADAEAAVRAISAIAVAAAAEVADRSRRELGTDGLAQRHGCSTPGALLEKVARISGAEANRRIHLGLALRTGAAITGEPLPSRFPSLAEAVANGAVGTEAATVIVRALDDVRRVASPDDLRVAEAGLVEHATQNRVQFVSDLAIAVRDRLDPDGVLPREEETKLRRGIQLGRERNGIVPIRGGLAPASAALLKSLFDEANSPGAQPRFLSLEDRQNGTVTTINDDGTAIVTVRDIRGRDQRQHDVLEGVIKAGIRNTGLETGQMRSTAEVTAHISIADLESGTGAGWIDGIRESVSVNTIEQLACDSIFRRAVLGNDGEILAFGKARYPFSSAQRKAIIVRDGDTCLLCDAPASWADTHHVKEFYTHGAVGETNVDNGVLLCPRDHDLIHHSEWQITMINGIPHVLAPPAIDLTQTWKRAGRPRAQLSRTG